MKRILLTLVALSSLVNAASQEKAKASVDDRAKTIVDNVFRAVRFIPTVACLGVYAYINTQLPKTDERIKDSYQLPLMGVLLGSGYIANSYLDKSIDIAKEHREKQQAAKNEKEKLDASLHAWYEETENKRRTKQDFVILATLTAAAVGGTYSYNRKK